MIKSEDLDREFSRYKYESKKEIERLNNNWQQAVEDMTEISNELGLEEGSTIYDILDKIKELRGDSKW